MTAVYQEILVEQGGTFTLIIDVLDSGGVDNRTDLAGWAGGFVIRADRDPASVLLATGTVTVDSAAGTATAVLSDAVTSAAEWSGKAQYDIWIHDASGTEVEPLAWGPARFRTTLIN